MKGCNVVVSGDDESCSTAFIRFGSVCVAGYRIAGCAIYCILQLFSVRVRVISWGPGVVVVKFCSRFSEGIVRSLSVLDRMSSSTMKSLLIVECALIVPSLIGGSFSLIIGL